MNRFKKMQRVWFWRGFLSVFGLYRPDPVRELEEMNATVDAMMKDLNQNPTTLPSKG